MDASGFNSDPYTYSTSHTITSSSITSATTSPSMQFPSFRMFQSPLSLLLSALSSTQQHENDRNPVLNGAHTQTQLPNSVVNSGLNTGTGTREVSIHIIGNGDPAYPREGGPEQTVDRLDGEADGGSGVEAVEGFPSTPSPSDSGRLDADVDFNDSGPSFQSIDIQHIASGIEHVLPFLLLLLVIFIRQHLQGFIVAIGTTAILFKSNDIIRKQTALKGERKIYVLVLLSIFTMLYVIGLYCWHRNDDLLLPLFMLPPTDIPHFWHAIFIIIVNDTLVRQTAMVFKCLLLMYYNGRGLNYRQQGQLLTLVEYVLLLYRALIPIPVWYRFFLNNEYGIVFSSLTTGLYLTFKLASVVGKVKSFIAAFKALSRKEVHYGLCATMEQVNAAGDICAICQEKMHAPLLLRCQHIFCEECVSEWLERERTCPLCRAVVKPADLQSFGDGSTSLLLQLF